MRYGILAVCLFLAIPAGYAQESTRADQRSVGDDRLTGDRFDTHVVGGQVATSFRNAIFRAAFSSTDSGAQIRSPWGSYPGYIGLMQKDFNRADEDAWLAGLSYGEMRTNPVSSTRPCGPL